ncbi:MAG: hypothetical protein MJ084_04530 [Saccharofermentans sp.]|nr:hypothetical protein [Saccharofermentans sp.]
MLYILTALKCEASALNGLPGETVVTGVGLKASERIAGLELTPDDRVINVGVCAGGRKGEGYLVNQVISADSGRRYYPDILFDASIPEKTLTTTSEIVTELEDGMLYDMEAALICEKALKVIPPSSLVIYKVVSDSGKDFPTANEVSGLIREHLDEIRMIAECLDGDSAGKNYSFLPEEVALEMKLTQYMRNELADIEHYCVASGRENELTDLIGKMRKEGRLPVKDKKGGREALDEIYACLR